MIFAVLIFCYFLQIQVQFWILKVAFKSNTKKENFQCIFKTFVSKGYFIKCVFFSTNNRGTVCMFVSHSEEVSSLHKKPILKSFLWGPLPVKGSFPFGCTEAVVLGFLGENQFSGNARTLVQSSNEFMEGTLQLPFFGLTYWFENCIWICKK